MLVAGCAGSDTVDAIPNAKAVDVVMDEMSFSPKSFEFRVGETISFHFSNRGSVRHEAVIGDETAQMAAMQAMSRVGATSTNGVQGRSRDFARHPGMGLPNVISLEPGEAGTITFSFAKAAKLRMQCHEAGHLEAGMTATITIVP